MYFLLSRRANSSPQTLHSVLRPSGPGRHLGVSRPPHWRHDVVESRGFGAAGVVDLLRFVCGGGADARVFHRCRSPASKTVRCSARISMMDGSMSGAGPGRRTQSSADRSAAAATRHVLSERMWSGLETTWEGKSRGVSIRVVRRYRRRGTHSSETPGYTSHRRGRGGRGPGREGEVDRRLSIYGRQVAVIVTAVVVVVGHGRRVSLGHGAVGFGIARPQHRRVDASRQAAEGVVVHWRWTRVFAWERGHFRIFRFRRRSPYFFPRPASSYAAACMGMR